jgi:hypothetical protein
MAVVHHHDVETGVRVTEERTWSERFGATQIVAFLIGVFYVVNGVIGVIRTGLNDFTGEKAVVLGLGMTALLALIHIAYGLLALTGLGGDLFARSTMGFLGTVAIIGGIIALAQPTEAMGWSDTNGIVYLITGALALVSMMFAHRAVIEERRTEI